MKLDKAVILLVIMSVSFFEVQAQQLYKWVDDQGLTHYGETLPDQDVDHITFEFTEDYQVANSQDDYYSIQNQLKRLQQRRAQQLAEKQQRAEARTLSEQQTVPDTIYVQTSEPERRYYLPAYYPQYKPHHYNNKAGLQYPKRPHKKQIVEKPRTGISQKAKAHHSGAVFSASR